MMFCASEFHVDQCFYCSHVKMPPNQLPVILLRIPTTWRRTGTNFLTHSRLSCHLCKKSRLTVSPNGQSSQKHTHQHKMLPAY